MIDQSEYIEKAWSGMFNFVLFNSDWLINEVERHLQPIEAFVFVSGGMYSI